jgi:hypothetical protein
MRKSEFLTQEMRGFACLAMRGPKERAELDNIIIEQPHHFMMWLLIPQHAASHSPQSWNLM